MHLATQDIYFLSGCSTPPVTYTLQYLTIIRVHKQLSCTQESSQSCTDHDGLTTAALIDMPGPVLHFVDRGQVKSIVMPK